MNDYPKHINTFSYGCLPKPQALRNFFCDHISSLHIFCCNTGQYNRPTHQSWASDQMHHIKNTESCCVAYTCEIDHFGQKMKIGWFKIRISDANSAGGAYLCKILKYPVDILTDTRQLQIVSRFLFGQKYKLASWSLWHRSKLKLILCFVSWQQLWEVNFLSKTPITLVALSFNVSLGLVIS